MSYQLQDLTGACEQPLQINSDELTEKIEKLLSVDGPRYRRLWSYYRNTMRVSGVPADEGGSSRPYWQAQEWGLPSRITGVRSGSEGENGDVVYGVARKEVVIENDIAWRVEAMVDYLFGKPIVINSSAPDEKRRQTIAALLRMILAHNGGILLFQQLALLGSVYGFVDVLVKFEAPEISNLGNNIVDALPCVFFSFADKAVQLIIRLVDLALPLLRLLNLWVFRIRSGRELFWPHPKI